MWALYAANRVGLGQFQHRGLNVSDGYGLDYTALIANDVGLVSACADHQAAAASCHYRKLRPDTRELRFDQLMLAKVSVLTDLPYFTGT